MPIRQVYSQLLRAAAKLIKDQLADIFALLFLVKYVGKSSLFPINCSTIRNNNPAIS